MVVYPNDDAKPPLGQGLNRKAQVTLDRIYPTNKQTRAPIKDVDTIINMDYDTTLRKACYKMEARFIDYIPESGSWIFKVITLCAFDFLFLIFSLKLRLTTSPNMVYLMTLTTTMISL